MQQTFIRRGALPIASVITDTQKC